MKEEAAFKYLLCFTFTFGHKIKQAVWPLYSRFLDISIYCCQIIILSPGDKTRSLLASALKIRTIIYMHILPSLTRCVVEQWRRYCRQELPICALDCPFFVQYWHCMLLDKILIKTLDFFRSTPAGPKHWHWRLNRNDSQCTLSVSMMEYYCILWKAFWYLHYDPHLQIGNIMIKLFAPKSNILQVNIVFQNPLEKCN